STIDPHAHGVALRIGLPGGRSDELRRQTALCTTARGSIRALHRWESFCPATGGKSTPDTRTRKQCSSLLSTLPRRRSRDSVAIVTTALSQQAATLTSEKSKYTLGEAFVQCREAVARRLLRRCEAMAACLDTDPGWTRDAQPTPSWAAQSSGSRICGCSKGAANSSTISLRRVSCTLRSCAARLRTAASC